MLLCGGCRSQLGAVYDVATGKATASDVAPARVALDSPPVTQAAFAPPPVDANTPAPRRALQVGENPLPEPTRDEAFAAVLDDLQAVGAKSQEAQQELLAQLQQAEPAHWESIARRFRSTVAFHQQLTTGLPPEPTEGLRRAGHVNTSLSSEPLRRAQPRRQPAEAPTKPSEGAAPLPTVAPVDQTSASEPPAPVIPRQAIPQHTMAPHEQPARDATAARVLSIKPAVESRAAADGSSGSQVRLASVEMDMESGGAPVKPMVVTNPYHGGSAAAAATRARPQPVAPETAAEAMAEAISLAEAQAVTDPLSTDEAYQHARLRLMRLAAGDADGAVAPIPGLSPTEQRYWSNQFFALSTMLDSATQPQSARRAAAAELHLAVAQQELEQMASLAVRNLTFCNDVYAFGGYEERPTRRFRAGEEVNLYVEIDNYRSEQTNEGYRTLLGGSYQVLDARGARVDGREFTPVDDYCLSRRRDFHMHFIIGLPERIYAGEYQLELTINDQLGNKIGRAAIDFEIVDDAKNAPGPRSARATR